MIASTFGTPFTYQGQFSPSGISQQGFQGNNPYGFQPYTQSPSLVSAPLSSIITSPSFSAGPAGVLQQVVLPLLQIVPQQLQHLQQLASVQLQELQRLQQVVQLLAGQVQIQQPSQFQQQPFGQSTAAGAPPWGIGPTTYATQPSHVM
jgi:hypothetical protein